ncbi:unnamed protein product [Chironomus riparius]|uniref:Zinc finger CCCH domain-containing protein 14 n=1 Tax=Chironomus riparius TaxID=315576 RepID=A0A9N9WUN0_9DIPT|nr:unnamed protein product [Chironomus riparius]
MDSLGEVGKKMRSAIKAKLVELGNASSTGYIDDELPDYVMIMVANKRPKQQMLVDLNLFLGSNTETFVNWLHQVLQKLQEVTLPTNLATKAKKKISETSSKKDKKKDKKKHPKEPSITDVIAVELMEKAKKTIDPKVKCEKSEKSRTPSPPPTQVINNSNSDKQPQTVCSSQAWNSNKSDDDLNIPKLSEIRFNKSNASNLLHKELGDLQNTEKKIQELKKNRRAISGPEDTNNKSKEKELPDDDEEMQFEASPEINTSQKERGSVKSRLGTKQTEVTNTNNSNKSGNIISLSAIRRSETEFLKKIVVKQKEDNERKVDDYRSVRNNRHDSNSSRNYSRRERRSRSNSRHRNRSDRIDRFRRRSRSRSPIKSHESRSRLSIRDRIGDKIQPISSAVVNRKHSKTPEVPDGNFKVKSRPTLTSSISSHAGKSMLLRAMADAQRSTQVPSDAKKRQRDNITVQVKNEKRNQSHLNDEEYVPESISGHSESEAEYHPTFVKNQDGGEDDEDVIYLNNNDDVDLDDLDDNNEMPKASPQFIVTLDNKDLGTITRKSKSKSKSHSPTPPKVIKRTKRTPVKDRIGDRVNNNRNSDVIAKEHEHRLRKRQLKEVEMEVEESEAQRAYNKVKKTRVSPIKFDLTDEEDGRNSRSSSRDLSEKKTSISKNDSDLNGEEHTKRIRLEASRSFDHVPALLSSIAVPVPESSKPVVVTKSKDRCKFYPNCSNTNCIYFHPTLPCKAFPNCKFGENCAYTHPACKFDRSCHRIDCNYTHSTPILPASTPVIASSIVPVQNYKSITLTPTMQVCKFFPSCTNSNCTYQHPKVCKFGKACANKFECNFYHFETASKSKFRWVSSTS